MTFGSWERQGVLYIAQPYFGVIVSSLGEFHLVKLSGGAIACFVTNGRRTGILKPGLHVGACKELFLSLLTKLLSFGQPSLFIKSVACSSLHLKLAACSSALSSLIVFDIVVIYRPWATTSYLNDLALNIKSLVLSLAS